MPQITFFPGNISVTVPEGAPLLDAARLTGISVETPCGGKGTCAKCLVRVLSGSVKSDQQAYKNAAHDLVLICRSFVGGEDAEIEVLSTLSGEEGKIEHTQLADLQELPEPFVQERAVQVPLPALLDGLSDLDRFCNAVKELTGCQQVTVPLLMLETLPEKLREQSGNVEVLFYQQNETVHMVDFNKSKNIGVAMDIGTTTVAVWITDMATGEILASKAGYNGQIECGLDIISRINYAKTNLPLLKGKVLDTVNGLIKEAAKECKIAYHDIGSLCIAGNTTMIHLLLGICPEYIRLDPYTPAVFDVPVYRAGEIGIEINHQAPVLIAPAVGSYVGGDITAGALCTSLADGADETVLFLDIGTNGEILLGNGDFILGCACSAGPAFEGGGIEHGMRASRGAIEKIKIDPETGKAAVATIENAPSAGLCGSAVISVVAELFFNGMLDAAGKFTDKFSDVLQKSGKIVKYIIDGDITISENDIDNFIRAKGAIFSACRTLLNSVQLSFSDLDKVYIAGGFGRYLNLENVAVIGLLPVLPKEKTIFLGNAALTGAYRMLVSKQARETVRQLAGRITYVDLSNEPGYMDEYMAALFIPHTERSLFG